MNCFSKKMRLVEKKYDNAKSKVTLIFGNWSLVPYSIPGLLLVLFQDYFKILGIFLDYLNKIFLEYSK